MGDEKPIIQLVLRRAKLQVRCETSSNMSSVIAEDYACHPLLESFQTRRRACRGHRPTYPRSVVGSERDVFSGEPEVLANSGEA